jgi:hypothetical protein
LKLFMLFLGWVWFWVDWVILLLYHNLARFARNGS